EAWIALATGADDTELSSVLTIRGNAPNPFNPTTSIAYDLPESGRVRLDVFSAAGDLVVTIEDGFREAGRHEAVWKGVDAAGRALPSGVYFARLEAGTETAVHKMVLLK
ncbi:T9SS type A sorting domain-containing protein, partial [bacterium]|nr:T9SS type A sorting domain-containing protein [bacterium]